MRKSYAGLEDFCAARNINNANSKIFQFNFARLPFIVANKFFSTRILFVG